MMDPIQASGGRNARLAHLRKFVCVPPERGHTLRLITCEDPPLVIGEWQRAACQDQLSAAEEIDTRLREHAQTQQLEVHANLVWQTDENAIVVSKRLRCRPEQDAPIDPAQAEALGVLGTEQSDRVLRARHHEGMMRMWFQAFREHQQLQLEDRRDLQRQMGEVQRQSFEMNRLLAKMLEEQTKVSHAAHLDLDKLRAQQRRELDQTAERVRDMLDKKPDEDPEKSARGRFIDQVTQIFVSAAPTVVEVLAERFLGGEEDDGPEPGDPAPDSPPKAAQ